MTVAVRSTRRAAPRKPSTQSMWRRELARGKSVLIGVIAAVVLVIIWYLLTLPGGLIQPLFLPPPQGVATQFITMLSEPYLGSTLWGHAIASLGVVLEAWALGGIIGIPLGIAVAWWKRARWIVWPLFQLIRPVPPLAWIPLAIVWLGIGDVARVAVVFVAALVPWVMNSIEAVRSIDPLLVSAARTLGASEPQILMRVVVRTGLPTILAGARIALGNAWTTLVAAEMLAATAGLGFVALNASRVLDLDTLLVAMGTIGILGAALSILISSAAQWIAPWAED
ncbi:ABC transporter permease [Humibacter albus]|uniref:ABC transporter permease n=1 Tax=Humibacter albus TaxID=427754 RepID=UPI0003B56496|nr:ABC transporter permease [Humibacter albus]